MRQYLTLSVMLIGHAAAGRLIAGPAARGGGELGLLPMMPLGGAAGRGILQEQVSSMSFLIISCVPQACSVRRWVGSHCARLAFGMRSQSLSQAAGRAASCHRPTAHSHTAVDASTGTDAGHRERC